MFAVFQRWWAPRSQIAAPSANPDISAAPELMAPRYWASSSMDAFVLRMATHGHCVNTAMMLGDERYAASQLAQARSSGCPELLALSERLEAGCCQSAARHRLSPEAERH